MTGRFVVRLVFYWAAQVADSVFPMHLLKRVQSALSGLMDGSLSTLAPIFAAALASHRPLTAFSAGQRPP
jgi:hypothetical protein